MKNLILIFISFIVFFSCKKNPEGMNGCIYGSPYTICDKPYTNYYVLTTINQITYKKTQINKYIELDENDTCSYLDYLVNINLNGYIVSEESGWTGGEKKYFINGLKEMNIFSNTAYNDSIKYYYQFHGIVDDKNFPGSVGYSPIMLYLTQPPDSLQLFYFTIELIDDEGHHFITTTTPVYITK